jgi:hypothetical protein
MYSGLIIQYLFINITMVLTRSMTAKLYTPNYTIEYSPNTYNPDNRISLVTEENIKNRSITLYDMYDIYNDIKYKSHKNNNGVIVYNDLRPLLFSTMGIFYNKIHKTMLKIKKMLQLYIKCGEKECIEHMRILRKTLTELEDIDIQFRQSGVNSHFGDFNSDNEVLEGFTEEEISQIYTQRLTPLNIIQMDLFTELINMYDTYISILQSAVNTDENLKEYFSEELCENNFAKSSVYGYISNIKFVVISE